MPVATGTVVDGKVIIEGLSLPEGTLVTVVTRESEAPVRLQPSDEAELLEALDEADREEGISAEELFGRLRRAISDQRSGPTSQINLSPALVIFAIGSNRALSTSSGCSAASPFHCGSSIDSNTSRSFCPQLSRIIEK
jgi:hypothetical protein